MRYQKIESKIWDDEKFVNLNPMQQRLLFYILTCPHGNLLGLFVLKKGYICEDLKCLPKDLDKDLESLCRSQLIYFDKTTQVVCIKNFLKHNPLTNPNQRKAAIKILTDLPNSLLINKFLVLNKGLKEVLPEVLLKPETETETETEEEYIPSPAAPICASKNLKSKKLQKTSLPSDFAISDEVITWATKHGYDRLEEHFESFCDRAIAKNYQYVNWDAAFKTAIREDWGKIRSNGNSITESHKDTCINHPNKRGAATLEGRWYCRSCLDNIEKQQFSGLDSMISNIANKLTIDEFPV